METPLALLPAVEQLALVSRRTVTCRELVAAALERQQRLNPLVRAVCAGGADTAFAAAERADARRAAGDPGPLLGLPVTVKDSLDVAGLAGVAGSPALVGRVSPEDAPAVRAALDAGAVVVGKTNVPEFCADMQTSNPVYGLTANPWDVERTPGGASGGSAAAVAAGFSALDIAPDLGGSNTLSAAFCGVFAHRPTHGLVSTLGLLDPLLGPSPVESAVATVGLLARDPRDLRLGLDVLLGSPAQDPAGWRVRLPDHAPTSLRGLRVAVWDEDDVLVWEPSARVVFDRMVQAMRDAGATLLRETRPAIKLSAWLRLAVLHCVTATPAVADGVHLHEEVAALMGIPRTDGASALTLREWQQLQRALVTQRQRWIEVFDEADVLVCPAVPCTAFPHEFSGSLMSRRYQVGADRWDAGQVGGWVAATSATGLPVTTAPIGLAADGLPVGAQIVAPPFHDRLAIAVAGLVSAEVGGYRPPEFRGAT